MSSVWKSRARVYLTGRTCQFGSWPRQAERVKRCRPGRRDSAMRPRLLLTVTAAAATALATAVGGPAVAKGGGGGAGGGTPAWTPPVYLAGGGAEPSIRNPLVGSHNPAAYISAPTGAGSNFWYVEEQANANGTPTFPPSPPQQPDAGTGGGDSEISVGNALDPNTGCATIAYSGLHNIDLLDNFTAASSPDCGHSFSEANLFATQNTLTDRQWQTFDGAKTNFLIYHKVDTSQIVVSRSDDGGRTYLTNPDGIAGVGGIIDAATMPKVANESQIGNIVTDYAHPVSGVTYPSGDPAHVLYATFAGPSSVADNAAANTPGATWNHNDTIYVAKSVDGGATWTDTVAYTSTANGRELNLLFPVVTVDTAGTVFAAWSDQLHVQYTYSKDGGRTWAPARQVNRDNPAQTGTSTLTAPTPGNADVFPWIAAGGAGRIDVVWYHGSGGAAGSEAKYRDPGDANTTWTVAAAQITGASSTKPTVASYSEAVSPVIHTGDICQNGINCDVLGGDRTLLDFFEVSIDTAGRANIAYASDAGSPGTASVGYIRQNTGASAWDGSRLTGFAWTPYTPPQGTSCPGPQIVAPAGDAAGSILTNPTGGNVDSADLTAIGWHATTGGSTLAITMTLKDLSATPQAGTASRIWDAYWSYAGKTWYVEASSNGPGIQAYDVGFLATDGSQTSTGSPAGTFTAGPNGTIVWTVDRSVIGSPPDGAVLQPLYGDSHEGFTGLGGGVFSTPALDRGPDSGGGASSNIRAC